MTLRLKNGLERFSDPDLESKGNQIIADLSLNFASAPLLPSLIAARDAFVTSLPLATDGGTVEKAIKNANRDAFIDQLHLMGYYVLQVAAGDRVVALKSGFDIAKAPSPGPEVTKAEGLKTEDGQNPGELKFIFIPVPGAKSYVYQAMVDPLSETGVWSSNVGTTSKFLFSGLESGKKYWIRVAAIGKNNQIVYSDPVISRIVQ